MGFSLIGSSLTPKRFSDQIKRCLYDLQNINELKDALKGKTVKIDKVMIEGRQSLGQFLDQVNPKLFPQKDLLLQTLAPTRPIKPYDNGGRTDDLQVADLLVECLKTGNGWDFHRASCAFKSYPILVDQYMFDENQTIRQALESDLKSTYKAELLILINDEEQSMAQTDRDHRKFKEIVVACFKGDDKKNIDRLAKYFQQAGIKEDEYIFDKWTVSAENVQFMLEFKQILKNYVGKPNFELVIGRLSSDKNFKDYFVIKPDGVKISPEPNKKDAQEENKPELIKSGISLWKSLAVIAVLGAVGYAVSKYFNKSQKGAKTQVA